ncbi:hypothetical protein [Burkholderia contaminans]|uniref:hypothetical protein n=1 Tax=Burkholderia TaxID=32008 RepID=UPI001CF15E13|nr:hypothetical protein [Burkholderia contaminans]
MRIIDSTLPFWKSCMCEYNSFAAVEMVTDSVKEELEESTPVADAAMVTHAKDQVTAHSWQL